MVNPPVADSATTQESRAFTDQLRREADSSTSFVCDADSKPAHAVEAAVWRLFDEHGSNNWDGGGAKALDVRTAHQAIAFVRTLPEGTPMPEIGVDPDGAITLEWAQSRHRSLTASVDATGIIPYAWIDHGDRGHAVERFDGLACPKRLLRDIIDIAGVGGAAIRVA